MSRNSSSRSSTFSMGRTPASSRPGSLVNQARLQTEQMHMLNQLAYYGRPRPTAPALRNHAAQQRMNQMARMPNRRPAPTPVRRVPSLSRRVNAQTAYIGNVHSTVNTRRGPNARRPAVPQRNVVFRNGKWQWST